MGGFTDLRPDERKTRRGRWWADGHAGGRRGIRRANEQAGEKASGQAGDKKELRMSWMAAGWV